MRRMLLAALVMGSLAACAGDLVESAASHQWLHLPDGDSLHYTLAGTGADTILVLGGGPAWPGGYLRDAFSGRAGDHAVLFLDLRGRGLSSPVADSARVTLEQDLADLFAALSLLRMDRAVLAGHAYGAGLAAMYALRHDSQVRGLVLLSPMFTHVNLVWQGSFQPNDSMATRRYLTARRLGRDTIDPAGFCREFWGFDLSPVEETDSVLIRRFARDICDATPANLRRMGMVSRAIRRSIGSWDWRDSLSRIQVPTLVVQGGGDRYLQRTGELWAELLPQASAVTLSRHPHFPWLEDAARFEASLQDFLAHARSMANRPPQSTRDKAVTPVQP